MCRPLRHRKPKSASACTQRMHTTCTPHAQHIYGACTHQRPKSTSVASAEARAASTRPRNECSAVRHLARVRVGVRVGVGVGVRVRFRVRG
eukprot:scaffold4229_cov67-Phaeocystis_antarctica.AAC.8